ncbi:MAG: hypothetical protein PVS2B2_20810 [Candidatus Acidiferrum sp.]
MSSILSIRENNSDSGTQKEQIADVIFAVEEMHGGCGGINGKKPYAAELDRTGNQKEDGAHNLRYADHAKEICGKVRNAVMAEHNQESGCAKR